MKDKKSASRIEPLEGTVTISTRPWFEVALAQTDRFREDLSGWGLADDQISEAVEIRDRVVRQRQLADAEIEQFWATTKKRYIDTPPEIEDLVNRAANASWQLRDWWEGGFVVERTDQVEFEVPLFVMGAATPVGSEATFTLKRTDTATSEWGVSLFGTGPSGSASLSITSTAKFPASAGETKLVFATVSCPVEYGTFTKGGARQAGKRIDLASATASKEPSARLVTEPLRRRVGLPAKQWPLHGNTGAAFFDYEPSLTVGVKVKIGPKIAGLEASVSGEIKRSCTVTLSYKLMGGTDYELWPLADMEGYIFK